MPNQDYIRKAQEELQRIFGEETVTIGHYEGDDGRFIATKSGKLRLYYILNFTRDSSSSFLPLSGNIEEEDGRRGLLAEAEDSGEQLAAELEEKLNIVSLSQDGGSDILSET
jgi:hypothetical protein